MKQAWTLQKFSSIEQMPRVVEMVSTADRITAHHMTIYVFSRVLASKICFDEMDASTRAMFEDAMITYFEASGWLK